MINALQTLRTVVNELLLRSGVSEEEKPIYYDAAIEGLRLFNMTIIRDGVVTAKKTPNSLNRIAFPSDMEDFVGLGVPVSGEVVWLTRNDKIVPTTSTSDGDEVLDSTAGEGVELVTAQLETLQARGGVNYEGYYTINWQNRKIIVNANKQTELILAYKSNGIQTSTETYVPARCVPALKAYILYTVTVTNPLSSESLVARYKMNWMDWERRLRRMEMFTLQEFEDMLFSTRTLLPK